MSTRVSTSLMIVRPTISLTPWARRYGGSSTLLIVSLMNMPLKIKRTFGGARGGFFSKAPRGLFAGRGCGGRLGGALLGTETL